METRRITIEDINSIFDIRNSVKENYLSPEEVKALGFTTESLRKMLLTDCAGWIILIDNYPVGFSIANKTESKILGLFIRPDFEGKGFGTTLLKKVEKWLTTEGSEVAWLSTSSNDTRAHTFYKRLGWEESGRMPNGQIRYTKKLVS